MHRHHPALLIFPLCALALILSAGPACAHRMNISAWLENDEIIVEANMGPNSPAANARVEVLDKDTRKELVQGTTDSAGRFTFAVPAVVREGHGLEITVNAGQGHRGVWSMDAAELYAAASLTAGFDQARIDAERGQGGSGHVHFDPQPAQGFPAPAQAQPSRDELRNIIHEALEVQLAPIRQQIAAQKAGGITLVEIIGGLGWIMGIVGAALFFMGRRKES